MNINYYRKSKENEKNNTAIVKLLSIAMAIVFVACGCSLTKNSVEEEDQVPEAVQEQAEEETSHDTVDIVQDDTSMIAYDMVNIGRSDPFMPSGEIAAYDAAKAAALKEASIHNAKVKELKALKHKGIREADDISPYKFNLPVPPTSLAPAEAAAAKITRTKVVGIMYNKKNPSALINVDNKDYLVRPGDKIIGQEYKVIQIDPAMIVVGLGSNVYAAGIGELFSKDEFRRSDFQNDLYNIKNRFGGRKG